jgi:hypothetical protein
LTRTSEALDPDPELRTSVRQTPEVMFHVIVVAAIALVAFVG